MKIYLNFFFNFLDIFVNFANIYKFNAFILLYFN